MFSQTTFSRAVYLMLITAAFLNVCSLAEAIPDADDVQRRQDKNSVWDDIEDLALGTAIAVGGCAGATLSIGAATLGGPLAPLGVAGAVGSGAAVYEGSSRITESAVSLAVRFQN